MNSTEDFCPNYQSCQIINIEGFISDDSKKTAYIHTYCRSAEKNWNNCKRFITKKTLNLCPDFVLPDSALSIDEILDKLENN